MMADLTINLRLEWEEAEADGSACIGCGDPVFLNSWRLRFKNAKTGADLGSAKGLACQSCKEAT